jgi:hypothetical protein
MDERIAWQMSYSVESDVSPAFAWRYRTDVANWNDPPAQFRLDGPFESGSRGTTLMPGLEPLRWRIGEVRPGERFVLEMALEGAALAFESRFEKLPEERTRMTQHIVLSGENGGVYAAQVEAGFGANLEGSMKRIAGEMEAAARLGA